MPMRARSFMLATVIAGALASAAVAGARIPAQWKNCAAVNHSYPHGIGKVGAHDSTSGDPVTNFRRSTKLYTLAMSYNRGLDRDRDSIACEQA